MKKIIMCFALVSLLVVGIIPKEVNAAGNDVPLTPLQSGDYTATGRSSISCHSASSSTRCMDTSTNLYVYGSYWYAENALSSGEVVSVNLTESRSSHLDATVSFSNGANDQSIKISGTHSFTNGSSNASGNTSVHYGN